MAEDVVLAVASNFLQTAETLATAFEAETGHSVTVEHGSTGVLFAQIGGGAAFDIFLAADTERPAALASEGVALETATYAIGSLALASRLPLTRDDASEAFAGQTVVLADPILAPYGKAATRAMEGLRLDTATFRPVLVANVGQVADVFRNGDAQIAFVAQSSLASLAAEHVLDLDGITPPLTQDAALLARDNPAATALWSWLFSDAAQAMIASAGYDLP